MNATGLRSGEWRHRGARVLARGVQGSRDWSPRTTVPKGYAHRCPGNALRRWPGYSVALMPASRMSLPHLSCSARTRAVKSAGDITIGSTFWLA